MKTPGKLTILLKKLKPWIYLKLSNKRKLIKPRKAGTCVKEHETFQNYLTCATRGMELWKRKYMLLTPRKGSRIEQEKKSSHPRTKDPRIPKEKKPHTHQPSTPETDPNTALSSHNIAHASQPVASIHPQISQLSCTSHACSNIQWTRRTSGSQEGGS